MLSDREPDVFALGQFIDRLIVQPAIAMADDFMTIRHEGLDGIRISLERLDHAEHTAFHVELLENPQDPPDAGARAVFERGLDDLAALAGISWKTGVGQHALRGAVAVHHGTLAAGLEI